MISVPLSPNDSSRVEMTMTLVGIEAGPKVYLLSNGTCQVKKNGRY